MNNFTASNGIIIDRVGADDEWTVDPLGKHARVSRAQMNALREFFQAEADERLGRWRWPENPDYVVYPIETSPDAVAVVSEQGGITAPRVRRPVGEAVTGGAGSQNVFLVAARAYFDAHPEPKPWHEAKPSEVWQIATASTGPDLYVVENTGNRFIHVERRLLALEVTAAEIVSGRRIWPEVSS